METNRDRLLRLAAEGPETPITTEWRQAMIAARKAAKLKQHELAAMVGAEQASISNIERAFVAQSKLVLAISEALGIAPPWVAIEDARELRWIELGRRMLAQDPEKYDLQIRLLERDRDDSDGGSSSQN